MPKKSPNRLRVTQLLEATLDQEWQQCDPGFIQKMQTVLTDVLSRDTFPPHIISKPFYPLEAHAMTSFNFFSGHIKRVLAGEHLGDSLMKELMIESSSNLYRWLLLRKMLQRQQYRMMTNLVGAAFPQQEGEPLYRPSYEHYQEVLLPKLAPMLEFLATPLQGTDKDFQLEIAALLHGPAYGDPQELLSKQPPDRRIANVITAFCFRNTSLENLHAGVIPPTEASILSIKQETNHNLKNWLMMMDRIGDNPLYRAITNTYWGHFCRKWIE
ncbi:MAG TPA: hypothetical protein VKR06_42740 [Ktedonosporobacter sp.]|nr:hypothetical protein [Ktedonosporobacter sp.]